MDRKEIVKVLGEHFGVKPKYMGVPSCAYQIETEKETYIIDRAGNITNAEGVGLELEAILNPVVEEITGEQEEKVIVEEVTETESQSLNVEISVPITGHTGISLRNLVNMIYSKQTLIQKALGITNNIIEDEFVTGINEDKVETIEEFNTAINNIGKEKCGGIEFDFEEQKIGFKFIATETDADKIKAYSQFIELLNKTAKSLKYASYKVATTDNDKFSMRTWLIRLGMVGNEYKATRKILLEKLTGNGAFRSGSRPITNNEIAEETTGKQ